MYKCSIKVITKLPNSEQSYKGKVKTHKYINRQNQSNSSVGCHGRNRLLSEFTSTYVISDYRH